VCSACAHVHTPFLHLAFSSVFMRLNRNDMRLTRVKCGDERGRNIVPAHSPLGSFPADPIPDTMESPLMVRTSANQEHDAVECGRAIRVLSVVDAYTQECLALEVDTSLAAEE